MLQKCDFLLPFLRHRVVATSPYVTAVGATQGPEDGNAEIVCQSTKGGVITRYICCFIQEVHNN